MTNTEEAVLPPPIVVVDIGKHPAKRVEKLCKGHGGLMDKVRGVIDEMRLDGTIGDTAQPIVIVVQEEAEFSFPLSGLFR